MKLPTFPRSFLSSGLQGFRSARQEARRRLDDSLKHLASDTDENPPVACTVMCLGRKWGLDGGDMVVILWLCGGVMVIIWQLYDVIWWFNGFLDVYNQIIVMAPLHSFAGD